MRSAPRLALPLLLLLLLHSKLLLAELLLLLELVAAPGRHDRRDRRKEARLKRTGWLAQRWWQSVGSRQDGVQGEYGAAGRYATRRRLSPASGASGSSAALLLSGPPCQRPQTPCFAHRRCSAGTVLLLALLHHHPLLLLHAARVLPQGPARTPAAAAAAARASGAGTWVWAQRGRDVGRGSAEWGRGVWRGWACPTGGGGGALTFAGT